MTSEDPFIRFLSGISSDVQRLANYVGDATDQHFEHVASLIRGNLSGSAWVPEAVRSPPLPPPPILANLTYLERAQSWISRNRALTAAIIAFTGTTAVYMYSRRKFGKKRRARRASSGARKEVVVIAGPVGSPIIRAIMMDLERRGFIVYIIVNSADEERSVRNEGRVDIRPLQLNVADPVMAEQSITRFNDMLASPHQAFSGTSMHNLRLTGLILVPDLIYPSGPVEVVSPELWSDALNAKVLNTVATTQALLPVVCDFRSRVLLITPSIIASLRPPFHAVESTIVGALDGFISSLRGELATIGIQVCQLKLGVFDFSGTASKYHTNDFTDGSMRDWSSSAKSHYRRNYLEQSRIEAEKGITRGRTALMRGTSPRELHAAIFDMLTQEKPPAVRRIGRGSLAYDIVGNWVPSGLVAWMLGVRKVGLGELDSPKLEDSVALSWERVDGSTPKSDAFTEARRKWASPSSGADS